MAFRFALTLLAVIVWIVFGYFASHRSEDPEMLGRYSISYFVLLMLLLFLAIGASIPIVPTVRRRTYRFISGLMLTGAACLFALVVAELLVRFLDPLGVSYYQESKRYHLDKIADPDLGFAHRPSYRAEYQGVDVSTNSLGLRDAAVEAKANDELRIVFLGDSVTFGWGVHQDEVFVRRLEQILSAKSARPVRVVNAGVGAYNTQQEYTWLRRVGLSLQPDLILLLYISGNDTELNEERFDPWSALSLEGKSPPQVVQLLAGRSWLFRLVQHVIRYGRSEEISDPTRIEYARRSQGWQQSMIALEGIARLAKEGQIPFITFFDGGESALTQVMLGDVRGAVAPSSVYETVGWFEGINFRDVSNSIVDSHLNARGHAIFAENMARVLRDQGGLGLSD